jgi:C4-dicarboxylate transporter DctQ subunit
MVVGKKFDSVLGSVVAVIYGVLIVVGLAQVVARYVFNNSLPWSQELDLILLTWLTFLSAGVALQKRLHIGIDVFSSRLSGRWQRVITLVGDLMTAVFVICLMYYGAQITQSAMAQTSPAMGLPMGLVYASVPVGAAVMLINLVRSALASGRDEDATDASDATEGAVI